MIAGYGWAMMAWGLAQVRTYGRAVIPVEPRPRGTPWAPAAEEYYRLLDETEAAWRSREDDGYTVFL
jgi:hypothetical protein